ncbi:MAG: rhamnan synthesis F family protein [Nitrospirota bacterium]
MTGPAFTILTHCYYGLENIVEIISKVSASYHTNVLINCPFPSHTALKDVLVPDNFILRKSPNVGKDIGGKLVLLDTFMKLDLSSKYLVFVHDKKSPHLATGEQWFKDLLRIIEPTNISQILSEFEKDSSIGIVATKSAIKDEYDVKAKKYLSNNGDILLKLQEKYQVNPNDYRYIAGTMFWVRTELILNFFKKFHPLKVREELEYGNVMDSCSGTFTHSWERMLTWLVTAQGYKIKGI